MFAKGKNAVARCQRSGDKIPYKDLVEDGYVAGLMVSKEWRDTAHPAERPVRTKEGIALRKPSVDVDAEEGDISLAYDSVGAYDAGDGYNGGTAGSLASQLFPGDTLFGGGT